MPKRKEKKRQLSTQPLPDSSATETNSQCAVVETLEHRRFGEFCDACKRYKYIGLCYGSPGVGKTVSARHYANWDRVEEFWERLTEAKATAEEIAASTTAFYTAPVVGSPHVIDREIEKIRGRLCNEVINLRSLAEQKNWCASWMSSTISVTVKRTRTGTAAGRRMTPKTPTWRNGSA
jgi:hypothetical protein